MKEIGIFTSWLVLIVFGSTLSGLTLSIMWGWFVVPVFGLAALSIPNAIGVSLIVGYMAKSITPDRDDKRTTGAKLLESFAVNVTKPAVSLSFGWVVTLFL